MIHSLNDSARGRRLVTVATARGRWRVVKACDTRLPSSGRDVASCAFLSVTMKSYDSIRVYEGGWAIGFVADRASRHQARVPKRGQHS